VERGLRRGISSRASLKCCIHFGFILKLVIFICKQLKRPAAFSVVHHCPFATPKVEQRLTCRSFFASLTDHSTLLGTAQVHRLDVGNNGKQQHQCVTAADGMDLDTVQKVPQLHLAQLQREDNALCDANVMNSTLGSIHQVCGWLMEAAL